MNSLKPLVPVLALLAILAVSLLVIQGLVFIDRAGILVPKPEDTAAEFVNDLDSHAIAGAKNELSSDLQKQISAEKLQALADSLNKKNGGVILANGVSSEKSGKGNNAKANANIEIDFQNGSTQSLSFPLTRDNGIWSLSSIGPLETFLGSQ